MMTAIFTLDYEIHGDGAGCPRDLMVEPTDRLLSLLDEYGAKLTIMADVAEILKFREYAQQSGSDRFHSRAIEAQLQQALRCGHDVQLHIHPSYFNAEYRYGRWQQDWSEYNFARLSRARATELVGECKAYLETLLRPVKSDYRCIVFRAANWAMSPSKNAIEALVKNGIEIDTSVFKYGRREGLVSFDYAHAQSAIVPWIADSDDICTAHSEGALWEYPIYSEHRSWSAFFSVHRFCNAFQLWRHRIKRSDQDSNCQEIGLHLALNKLCATVFGKHAWKADFNQCTGKQLARALLRAARSIKIDPQRDCPFILIGHSKLFTRANERTLRSFLQCVVDDPLRFRFGTFYDVSAGGPAGVWPTKKPEEFPLPAFAKSQGY